MDGAGAGTEHEVERELTDASAARRERDRLVAQRQAVEAQIEISTGALRASEQQAALLDEDIHKLEGASLARILAGLRGVRDAELTRAQAQRELASYAVREAAATHRALDDQRADLVRRIEGLGDVDRRWTAALDARQAQIEVHRLDGAVELGQLAERRGRVRAERREVTEALAAAVDADAALVRAAGHLGSADNWSFYDTWLGGGMFSSAIKHDRIDVAAAELRRVDRALARLSVELADLGRAGIDAIAVRPSTRTFDIFFDNIFSDMKVASQIASGRDRVLDARRAVARVHRDLTARAEELDALQRGLEEERAALLGRGLPG
ncbi:MAG: hypothetical protein R2701_01915 [Acidimicrobiales bacterium]